MKRPILIVLTSFFSILYSQTTATLFLPAGNYTVPCGVTSITVTCWGAGGGGAGDATAANGISGGGGGGGGYSQNVFAVVPGQVIPYNVGSAGAAGAGTPSN